MAGLAHACRVRGPAAQPARLHCVCRSTVDNVGPSHIERRQLALSLAAFGGLAFAAGPSQAWPSLSKDPALFGDESSSGDGLQTFANAESGFRLRFPDEWVVAIVRIPLCMLL